MFQTMRRLAGILMIALLAAAAVPAPALAAAASAPGGEKVNINAATADQLTALPGIGPSYAQRIVEYREKNGPFKKVEDLLNVTGIGEKTFEKIKDRITVGSK